MPAPEAFTVKVRSITRPVGNVEHSLVHHDIEAIDQDRHIVLTLDDYLIRQGETVTVSYTDPTTGDDADAVQDDHGNDAPSFTDIPATNLSEIAPTRPTEPTGLSALRNDTDPTTVKLTWNTPERSEGREITGYRIEYRTADVQWTDANPDTKSTDTTWTHPNVPSTGTIKYRVSAINLIATGPASQEARTDAMKPDKPTGLTATPNGFHQIDLSWTMPNDQGSRTPRVPDRGLGGRGRSLDRPRSQHQQPQNRVQPQGPTPHPDAPLPGIGHQHPGHQSSVRTSPTPPPSSYWSCLP